MFSRFAMESSSWRSISYSYEVVIQRPHSLEWKPILFIDQLITIKK